jgi:hypothetical protein
MIKLSNEGRKDWDLAVSGIVKTFLLIESPGR